MSRLLGSILMIVGLFVPVCSGQTLLDDVNFRTGQFGGLHLIGVSVFTGYSTSAYPQGGFALNTPGVGALGGDMSYGASASLGWQHSSPNSSASVLYGGTYSGMARYSNLNAFNQSLSLSATRTLGQKWTFSVTASGLDSTVAQYLFQPSSLSVITQLPATFDDLAAAFAAGQYSNAQAASILTGAPVMQAAGRSLLLGNRILTYSANASLGYAVSSRMRLHFSSFTAAGQSRLGSSDSVTPASYIMPRSLGANAGAGFSYSLSPRTEIGANIDANRTVNHFQAAYGSTAGASLGRKMGMHWFLNVHGGVSYNVVTQQTFGTPKTRQMVGGGSLGFRPGMHTLVASYDRSGSDSFGFAVGTVTTTSAAWSWHPAGSRWAISASFGEQQTRNTGFSSLSAWQAGGGITTGLNTHMTLSAQYVYMSNTGTYLGTFNNLAVQSVRLSLGWAPQIAQR
jgi:hypothetical protein